MNPDVPALRGPRRLFYVDAIRAVSCLLVVFSHIFAPVCAGMNDYPRSVWWVFNLFDSIIRPSASLFIMISGTIFLSSSRDDSYTQFVWKRYSRLFLPFFTWSMIYAFFETRLQGNSFSTGAAILQFIQGPTEYHLWFMYLILGLYLLIPFLRRFVRKTSPKAWAVFLLLWMSLLIVEFLRPGYPGAGAVTRLVDYSGYLVLGYALSKVNIPWNRVFWVVLLALGVILFNAGMTYHLTLRNGGTLNERYYFGTAPLVAVYGAAFFLILKSISYEPFLVRWPALRGMVTRLSLESYNVYLMHPLFIWLFTQDQPGLAFSDAAHPNPLIGVPLAGILVTAACLVLSLVLQKIPIVSRLFVMTVRTNS